MKNINMNNIDEVREAYKNVYNEFEAMCSWLQPELRKLSNVIEEEMDALTEKDYQEIVANNKDVSKEDIVTFEEYKDNMKSMHMHILSINSNLSVYKINYKHDEDYGDINLALSLYFKMKFALSYANKIYEDNKECLEEIKEIK